MNKKLLLTLFAAFLLACNLLFPPKRTSAPIQTSEPASEPGVTSSSEPASSDGLTIVRLRPGQGDLQTRLEEEAQKAAKLGQVPVVEFDATWCPPCLAIDKAIKEKNALMMDAYAGMYIIKLDVDEWGWGDSSLHDFEFDAIPVYFKLDSEGNQTGELIDGGAWGQDIPENIAPVMDKFFHVN